MDDSSRTSDLRKIASVLCRHGVEFIVIGGQAETLMGSPRVTFDVDICYRREKANYAKLAASLRELNVRLRNVPEGIPFLLDARTLEIGSNFTFDTSLVDFDILGYVEPLGGYDEILRNARTYPVGELKLSVISLDDLIRVKRHINRPKDRESLLQLLAIKKVLAEQGKEDPSEITG